MRRQWRWWAALGAIGISVLLVAFRGNRDDAGFTLEVPATYLSVGQQIQSRLLSDGPAAAGSEPITISLLDSAGHAVQNTQVALAAGATAAAEVAAPKPGRYTLQASNGSLRRNVTLDVAPEPPADFGGILALTALGVPSGASQYLRAHGFAVTPALNPDALAGARTIVIGDPRLGVPAGQLDAMYSAVWRRADAGANVLLLEPPTPAVGDYWPADPPLLPAHDCAADLQDPVLLRGLPANAGVAHALEPLQAFDLQGEGELDLYSRTGIWLPRPNRHAGYPGCHAIFSYRYGAGWVTVSTAPLLDRFQDLRARIVLMNLIASLWRRHPRVPPSPGLAWVTQQRLRTLAQHPANPFALETEVWYRPAPANTTPLPQLLSPGHGSCWTSPTPQEPGASVRLDLGAPLPIRAIDVNFGANAQDWPVAQRLEASSDGLHWAALPPAAPQPNGDETVALPASAAGWRDVRLTLSGAAPRRRLRICQFAPQPQ